MIIVHPLQCANMIDVYISRINRLRGKIIDRRKVVKNCKKKKNVTRSRYILRKILVIRCQCSGKEPKGLAVCEWRVISTLVRQLLPARPSGFFSSEANLQCHLNPLRSVERRFLRSAVIGLKFLGDENWQFWSKRFLSKMISLSFFNNAICNDVTYPTLNISQVASAPYQMESRKIFTFSHYSFVILNSFHILRFFFERQILRQLYHTR